MSSSMSSVSSALLRAKSRASFSRLLFESEMNNGGGCEQRSFVIKCLQVIVILVRLITPASYAFLAYTYFYPHHVDTASFGGRFGNMVYNIIWIWALAEALFFPYYYYLFLKFQGRNSKLPHFAKCEISRMQLLKNCFGALVASAKNDEFSSDATDCNGTTFRQRYIRNLIEGWFLKVPIDSIFRENMKDWLAWAYFDKKVDELDCNEMQENEQMTDYIESISAHKFAPGRNPHLMAATLTLDPTFATQRPLILYLSIYVATIATNRILEFMGFRLLNHYSIKSQKIWYRKGSEPRQSGPRAKLPVVFIHGIGFGFNHYLAVIFKLPKDVDVFLISWPHVAQQMQADISTAEECIDALAAALRGHGIDRASFVGHSLGTTMISWMLRHERTKDFVASSVLIDPVTFILCHPKVATAFVYRDPTSPLEFMMHFFLARELFIANALSRHFSWSHNIVFAEDLFNYQTYPLSYANQTNNHDEYGFYCDTDASTPSRHSANANNSFNNTSSQPPSKVDENCYRIISSSNESDIRHTIMLSRYDFIVPVSAVVRYFHSKHVEVNHHHNFEVLLFEGNHGHITVVPQYLEILHQKILRRSNHL